MDIIDNFLPAGILDYFELKELKKSHKRYDIYLDEHPVIPDGEYTYSSKGFTDAATIQDFPIRGHAVYLHIRRRKWLEKETGRVITNVIDISHDGTGLTGEFASFLKKIGLSATEYL
jgi:transposase